RALVALAGGIDVDHRADGLAFVAPALLLALAYAQRSLRRFQPPAARERDGLVLRDEHLHHDDAFAALLDDEPRLDRFERDDRHPLLSYRCAGAHLARDHTCKCMQRSPE